MMEHVKLFDWCYNEPDRYFVKETDLDNCCTESILKNKFYDPLVSSESDDDNAPVKIDWDSIFKNKKIVIKDKLFVPGLKPMAPYPKLSSITGHQHYKMLKVLSYQNPHILPGEKIGRPNKMDFKLFQDLKETYLAEQKEYIEWAKCLWQTDHCIRALRPKPAIEKVYEAEFKIRAQRLIGYPQNFVTAAQIPLESKPSNYEMVLMDELISVKTTDLPEADIPDDITKQLTVTRPCTVPEPCYKHPCQFVLPMDKCVSMLPLREVHRSLAQYSSSHSSQLVLSEGAMRCLVQLDRAWSLPLSVCDVITPDGEVQNVVVIDSEFCVLKEAAPLRTHRALRHLLENVLVSSAEKQRVLNRDSSPNREDTPSEKDLIQPEDLDITSDEEDQLVIDTPEDTMDDVEPEPQFNEQPEDTSNKEQNAEDTNKEEPSPTQVTETVSLTDVNDVGVYTCSCKDSLWEKPPPRSFKRWQIRSSESELSQDFIVHCAHKVRSGKEEIILEPIPEYQLELGASKQSDDALRSLALSVILRPNATIVNVRIDAVTGEIVTIDRVSGSDFLKRHKNVQSEVINTLHSATNQLQGLMPGHYVLRHEPIHGKNCMLLVGREGGKDFHVQFNSSLSDTDEIKHIKPPTITNTLLPYHKHRRVLPCAFTAHAQQVSKDTRRLTNKLKVPPQAIKWPKRKKNKKKKQ